MATPFINTLDAEGLTLATRAEVVTYLTEKFQEIYGADIDVSSSSPDGQMINIIAQIVVDIENLVTQVYNSFNPDAAIGVSLDQRVAINGIQRQVGTYTLTPISITVDRALTLYGLDQVAQPVFTVADAAGNEWQLVLTQSPAGAGTASYSFRAANPGRVVTVVNTITVPVSVVLGVTAINNPATYTTLGTDEESDAALKIRRQKAVSSKSGNFIDSMYAALTNVTGVTTVFIRENDTDTEDAQGVPPHSVWVIVGGTGDPALIAEAIYSNLTGCGMKGATSYNITQADGTSYPVFWDAVTTQNIYVDFTQTAIENVNFATPVLLADIIAQLPLYFIPEVGQEININALATAVQQIDPNCLVTDAGLSTSPSGPFTTTLEPSANNIQFVLLSENIYILPCQLLPQRPSVPRLGTQQFTPYGGTQTGWNYSIVINNSGGSIDANGLYTAGPSTAGPDPGTQDVIYAADSDGNICQARVTVT